MHLTRIAVAVAFTGLEKAYSGWNRTPQSPEEVIADGLALLMLIVATL
jgi:hypothetical protein